MITKGNDDAIELLINDNVVVKTETATTTIANISMTEVIIEIMFWASENIDESMMNLYRAESEIAL